MISHRQRLEICLEGEQVDRPPVAFWRHFPVDDQSADGLARATFAFQKTFDFDLVKVTPASSFCLRDWGAKDEWLGSSEGTRSYKQRVIQKPEDWRKLPVLDPKKGALGQQLDSLRLLIKELGPETPAIQTIFNPLSQAKNLVGGDRLLVHLRRYPDAVHAGLQTIVETSQRFIEAAIETGIAGIFYAVQHAQYGLLSTDEYAQFGTIYDLQVLDPAQSLWLNMIHLHGLDVMFDLFTDFPVDIINWHDQETPPSLKIGQRHYSGVVCGGIRREETMVLGTPEKVRAEAQAAIEITGGKKFILGTGCVIPTITPFGNILAARNSVGA